MSHSNQNEDYGFRSSNRQLHTHRVLYESEQYSQCADEIIAVIHRRTIATEPKVSFRALKSEAYLLCSSLYLSGRHEEAVKYLKYSSETVFNGEPVWWIDFLEDGS
jgi:hypothetical protein